MRGGTSKAFFYMRNDLPTDAPNRDRILLEILALPQWRDQLGMGKDSLSSKTAIISPSTRPDADIDYFFAQGDPAQQRVDTSVSCGNILSAVGPFAIEAGLVRAQEGETTVRVLAVNTGVISSVIVATPGGKVTYAGTAAIDGVPGTAAPVLVNYLNAEGAKTGSLLPTGNPRDVVEGIDVSCVDAAVPVVFARAADFGKTGSESPAALNADKAFLARLETVRRAAAQRMGLGDVADSVMPKFALVAAPCDSGTIRSRYFTPTAAHTSYAVTGALCLATACHLPGTVAAEAAVGLTAEVNIEHPAGKLCCAIELREVDGRMTIPTAAFVRTADRLADGEYPDNA